MDTSGTFDARTLEAMVRASGPLFTRFLDGFDDQTRVAQAPALPNHVSWTIGHVSLIMHRAADLVRGFTGPQNLPTSDWVHGDGTAGDPGRYDTESVCYGSTPSPVASKYPRLARAVEIFNAAIDRLASDTAGASPASLVREIAWGNRPIIAAMLVHRVVFHTATHAGQITDLRRSLGLGPVIG